MKGGGPSLIRDWLDEVFRILVDPIDDTERIVVLMAKVLQSISRSNTNLNVEIDQLEGMASHFHSSISSYHDSRENAIAALAVAFALQMKKWPMESNDCNVIPDTTDRVKQEPSLTGGEEIERITSNGQFKQEVPEEENYYSMLSPLYPDPFIHTINSTIDDDCMEVPSPRVSSSSSSFILKPSSSIKREMETERMEIIKRRMVGSQLEMDEWPVRIKRECNEEESQFNPISLNNNSVDRVSLSSSSSSSIPFRCPLSSAGVCNEERWSKEECYYHVQLSHPDYALPFACNECALAFRYKHELREHKEIRHSAPVKIRSDMYIHKLYFPSKVQCPHCAFTCSSSRLFLSHHSAEHSPCAQPHLSCTNTMCRRRFKFSNITQVIYHFGAVGTCKGQCVLIK